MGQAPVIVRGLYSDLFSASMLPVLEELFRSTIALSPPVMDQAFAQRSTERDIWQYTELGDLPLHSELDEGDQFSFFSMAQGSDKTLVVKKFGLGASISEEAMRDGKFDLVSLAIQHMARSARESKEIRRANIFNNGFTSETTADGQPIFDQAHIKPLGGTFRNELAVAADLSQSTLDTALVDFRTQFTSDNGLINMIQPRILLVPPQLERQSKELIGSQLKPETANNDLNAFLEDGLRVVVSPHLTDTDAWFILADPDSIPTPALVVVDREGVQTKSEEEFDTDSIKYKSKYREVVAGLHGYGIFGSPGA